MDQSKRIETLEVEMQELKLRLTELEEAIVNRDEPDAQGYFLRAGIAARLALGLEEQGITVQLAPEDPGKLIVVNWPRSMIWHGDTSPEDQAAFLEKVRAALPVYFRGLTISVT